MRNDSPMTMSKRTTFIKIAKGIVGSCIPILGQVKLSKRFVTMVDDGHGIVHFLTTDARTVNINTTLFYR